MVDVCTPPDTINLKQMSSQLRRDRLRRRAAGSHGWQEVTVGRRDGSAVCFRNVLRFPLHCRRTRLAPTEGIMGESFFHWMRAKKQESEGIQRGSDGFMNKTSGEEEGMDGKEGMQRLQKLN